MTMTISRALDMSLKTYYYNIEADRLASPYSSKMVGDTVLRTALTLTGDKLTACGSGF